MDADERPADLLWAYNAIVALLFAAQVTSAAIYAAAGEADLAARAAWDLIPAAALAALVNGACRLKGRGVF